MGKNAETGCCTPSGLSPVAMVGYARSATLKLSLARLAKCENLADREIYLFLDAPYRTADQAACETMYQTAKAFADDILPNLHVIRRTRNYGVPGNLISAISEVLESHGRLIFFEDDVLVSKTFLTFMDEALDIYAEDKRIFCINGFHNPYFRVPRQYREDVLLSPRNMAWGFGIWRDRWSSVDFSLKDWHDNMDANLRDAVASAGYELPSMLSSQKEGRIHTWDVQCTFHMVQHHMFAVEPRFSLTKNIGFSENSGVHCAGAVSDLERMPYYDFRPRLNASIEPSELLADKFRYATLDPRLKVRIFRKLVRVWRSMGGMNLESRAM